MKDKVEVIAEYAWNPVKDGGRTLLRNLLLHQTEIRATPNRNLSKQSKYGLGKDGSAATGFYPVAAFSFPWYRYLLERDRSSRYIFSRSIFQMRMYFNSQILYISSYFSHYLMFSSVLKYN